MDSICPPPLELPDPETFWGSIYATPTQEDQDTTIRGGMMRIPAADGIGSPDSTSDDLIPDTTDYNFDGIPDFLMPESNKPKRQARLEEYGIRERKTTLNNTQFASSSSSPTPEEFSSILDVWQAGTSVLPANIDIQTWKNMVKNLPPNERELANDYRRQSSKRYGARLSNVRLKYRIDVLEKTTEKLIHALTELNPKHSELKRARDVLYTTDKQRRSNRRTKPLPSTRKIPLGVGKMK